MDLYSQIHESLAGTLFDNLLKTLAAQPNYRFVLMDKR
jgi:hypothetical protein